MHHYLSCGLDYVWLQNGYIEGHSDYGPTIAFKDIDGLHESIALAVIDRAGKLSGPEIRFLRHFMELSQSSLAELIGVTAQSIALWEKNKGTITGPSDKLIRLLVKGHISGQATIRRAIDALNRQDAEQHGARLVLRESDNKWRSVA